MTDTGQLAFRYLLARTYELITERLPSRRLQLHGNRVADNAVLPLAMQFIGTSSAQGTGSSAQVVPSRTWTHGLARWL